MEKNTQHFKEKLLTEKQQLEEELADLGIKDPQSGDWGAVLSAVPDADKSDTNDLADRYEEFGEQAYTLGEIEKRYRKVEQALAAIEVGTYGTCISCKQPIEEKRLEADPAATTCIEHREEESTSDE